MQRNNPHRQFTLIELLTVIVIIMILVGILIPTVQTVRQRANETRARAMISSMKVAISQYQQTYASMPYGTPGSDALVADADYTTFIDTLSGTNARGIVFLEEEQGGGYADPWGNNLHVALDLDYDGDVEGVIATTVNSTSAIWSNGRDRQNNNGTGDDLTSWGD